jgi:enamine deaminase RidA (YjgF/YER057c/UK114 family)
MTGPGDRRVHRDGSPWESVAGYVRALRCGHEILVSGTTASAKDGTVLHPGDVGAQTRAALEKAVSAIEALGGRREGVVRTRVYLVPGADWEAAARAHADRLGDVAPTNTTLFVGGLVGEGLLVEVEAEARA